MTLSFGRVPLWLGLQLLVLLLLFVPACKTMPPSQVEVPKEPEPYLAKIVDYGASSHNGYFLQKNVILKYSHELSAGGRAESRKEETYCDGSPSIARLPARSWSFGLA